jgi:tRNA-specific 2-thiouridylase
MEKKGNPPTPRLRRGKKVIVAMSGGVDSSVSAALLKKAGFDVTGMFMKCWDASDPLGESCTSTDDERMARLVAEKIGIPFYSINLVKEYKTKVVEYLLNGYRQGITPNPDVMCNKEIKFGLFFDKAMALGADFVATGHYARTENGKIYAGKDTNKDQSYFLSFIRPEVLGRVMFPIGEYTKPEVRALARKFGLPNAGRKDSQGICFVGKVDFVEFLKQYIPSKMGDIVDTEGNVLGQHEGAVCYTVGQRKGLGLSGGPYFIIDKDVQKNILVVSKNEKNLFRKEVNVKDLNWFQDPVQGEVTARVRYRQTPARGIFVVDKSHSAGKLIFYNPQRAITPGQLAVLYQGDQMLAGGVIE